MQTARTILIAGPTASGKSGLAVALAERLGGTVINADSMQVYRDLRILTARPTPEDEARVPHALYGFVSGAEAYSAGRYAVDVASAIADARAAGRVPIVVGGTGLYFKVLLEGLSPVPAPDPQVRDFWRAQASNSAGVRTACPSGRARPRDGRASDADRSPAHRACPGGAGKHRPLPGRVAARARPAGAARA